MVSSGIFVLTFEFEGADWKFPLRMNENKREYIEEDKRESILR